MPGSFDPGYHFQEESRECTRESPWFPAQQWPRCSAESLNFPHRSAKDKNLSAALNNEFDQLPSQVDVIHSSRNPMYKGADFKAYKRYFATHCTAKSGLAKLEDS